MYGYPQQQYYPPPPGYGGYGYGYGYGPGPSPGYGERGMPTSYNMDPNLQQGPPQYHGPIDTHPQGGMMNGNMPYEYSNMQGKRKALLIGINYVGTNSQLNGCWNDAHNMANFIRRTYTHL